MRCQDFNGLVVARFEVALRARAACSLPAFLGSTLRGAFGHALREAVRLIDGRDCNGCNAANPCAYHYLFETPIPPQVTQLRGQREAPVPFILSPPVVQNPVRRVWRMPTAAFVDGSAGLSAFARNPSSPQFAIRNPQQPAMTSVIFPDGPRRFRAGDMLSFNLALIGCATEYLKYVVPAIDRMASCGLGANRASFNLAEIHKINEQGTNGLIYSEEGNAIEERAERVSLSDLIRAHLHPIDSSSVNVRFLTPTRIRVNGDLQTELSFELLVRNLLRRVSMLAAVHGSGPMELDYRGLIERAKSAVTRRSSLRWWDLERYTNRQGGKLRVGGLIGKVQYEGEVLKEFLPLVVAGEILHVGTGTSFGLGKFVVAPSSGS